MSDINFNETIDSAQTEIVTITNINAEYNETSKNNIISQKMIKMRW